MVERIQIVPYMSSQSKQNNINQPLLYILEEYHLPTPVSFSHKKKSLKWISIKVSKKFLSQGQNTKKEEDDDWEDKIKPQNNLKF